jgi:nitroreductase
MRLAPPPPVSTDALRDIVDWVLASRRSIRAFSDTPVARADIEDIVSVARYSASGVNTQPWQVHVVTGAAKEQLSGAILKVYDDPALMTAQAEPYDYYPDEWRSPYIERRRQVGWELYGLLGIEKGDRAGMHMQHARNFRFFDAPVGLMFTIDRTMGRGSLIDYGMFLQSIMVAARARGLDTCPQAAFNTFHDIIAQHLAIPDEQMLVCGMSLGYAAPGCIENTLVTKRESTASFTTFHTKKNQETAK